MPCLCISRIRPVLWPLMKLINRYSAIPQKITNKRPLWTGWKTHPKPDQNAFLWRAGLGHWKQPLGASNSRCLLGGTSHNLGGLFSWRSTSPGVGQAELKNLDVKEYVEFMPLRISGTFIDLGLVFSELPANQVATWAEITETLFDRLPASRWEVSSCIELSQTSSRHLAGTWVVDHFFVRLPCSDVQRSNRGGAQSQPFPNKSVSKPSKVKNRKGPNNLFLQTTNTYLRSTALCLSFLRFLRSPSGQSFRRRRWSLEEVS